MEAQKGEVLGLGDLNSGRGLTSVHAGTPEGLLPLPLSPSCSPKPQASIFLVQHIPLPSLYSDEQGPSALH